MMVPIGSEVQYEHAGVIVTATVVGHEGEIYVLSVPGITEHIRAEPKRPPDVFRFIIACVTINCGVVETIHEQSIVEAGSFEEAAALADAAYPKSQISVTRIGRCIRQHVVDPLPMVSGASA